MLPEKQESFNPVQGKMQHSNASKFKEELLQPKKPEVPLNVDDQVLPAITQANAGQGPSEYAPGEEFNEEEFKSGEPIAPDKRDVAHPLIDVFGEQTVRKIFSRTWALREEGIGEVEDMILGGKVNDINHGFISSISVIKETIGDKISGVCLRSIKFLENLCNSCRPQLSGA